MATLDELPRSDDGAIIGQWRLIHESASFEGGVGAVNFVKGRADRPMEGAELNRFMAAMGSAIRAVKWDGPLPEAEKRSGRGKVYPQTARSKMSQQERDEIDLDEAKARAKASIEKHTAAAKYAGRPPHVPAAARAEIDRLKSGQAKTEEFGPPNDTAAAVDVPEAEPTADQSAVTELIADAGDDLDELRGLAEAQGVKVDRRWRAERLRAEIQSSESPSGPDDVDGITDPDILRAMAEGLGIDLPDSFVSAHTLRAEIRKTRGGG